MFLNCLSPVDSECHMASSSLPAWGPITVMTTLVTGQRDKSKPQKPLGRFSRKIEQLEFLAFLTPLPHPILNVSLCRKLLEIISKALEEYDCSSKKHLRPVVKSVSSMPSDNSIRPLKK